MFESAAERRHSGLALCRVALFCSVLLLWGSTSCPVSHDEAEWDERARLPFALVASAPSLNESELY
jgi:hypothetical protein